MPQLKSFAEAAELAEEINRDAPAGMRASAYQGIGALSSPGPDSDEAGVELKLLYPDGKTYEHILSSNGYPTGRIRSHTVATFRSRQAWRRWQKNRQEVS